MESKHDQCSPEDKNLSKILVRGGVALWAESLSGIGQTDLLYLIFRVSGKDFGGKNRTGLGKDVCVVVDRDRGSEQRLWFKRSKVQKFNVSAQTTGEKAYPWLVFVPATNLHVLIILKTSKCS